MSQILRAVMGDEIASRIEAAAAKKEAAAVKAFWNMKKGDLSAWKGVSRVKPLPQSQRLSAEIASYWND